MFGRRLKELRVKHDLTQEDIAKIVRKSPRTIGHWESGRNEPELADVVALADYFRVSVDYLLGRTDDTRSVTDRPIAAHQKGESDSDVDVQALSHLIERVVERVLERRRKQRGGKDGGSV